MTEVARGDRLVVWPVVAMVSLLVAATVGASVGLAQTPRPLPYHGGMVVSMPARPGERLTYVAWTGFPKPVPSRLVGIALIPVPGYALPRLVRHGVYVGSGQCGFCPAVWPPRTAPGFAGQYSSPLARPLSPWQFTTPTAAVDLEVSVPPGAAEAAWAGIALTYLLDGVEFTSPDANGGVICVTGRAPPDCATVVSNAVMATQFSPPFSIAGNPDS